MKPTLLLYLFPLVVMACTSGNQQQAKQKIIFQPKDQEIFNQITNRLASSRDTPVSRLMIKTGEFFTGTPYVAHTLEIGAEEQLVINLREMDCTTFAENCLAIARSVKSGDPTFEQFTKELQRIRYRNRIIDGYPSRLHYFSDWIYDNNVKQYVKDISRSLANTLYVKETDFMSTHPESYRQLTDSSQFTERIVGQEKEISQRKMYYVPEEELAEVEAELKDGDIAGITTNIKGLDILHVVLLIRKEDGRIHLLHASSAAGKVVVSENTLEDYLLNSKSATGIMVARPL